MAEIPTKECRQGKIKCQKYGRSVIYLFSLFQRQHLFLLVYWPIFYVGQWMQSRNKKIFENLVRSKNAFKHDWKSKRLVGKILHFLQFDFFLVRTILWISRPNFTQTQSFVYFSTGHGIGLWEMSPTVFGDSSKAEE